MSQTHPSSRSRRHLLITAGPTHEPLDAVRYLGNRSSGRMGLALADAAVARGWPSTLLLGPIALIPPEHSQLRVERFRTTEELADLLASHWPGVHDTLIMAAAVADFRPRRRAEGKLRRTTGPLTLELEPTPDLLAELAATTPADRLVIGFALEPASDLEANAVAKMKRKGVDAIVANPLETMDAGEISAVLFAADGGVSRAPEGISKREFAEWLLDWVESAGRTAGQSTQP